MQWKYYFINFILIIILITIYYIFLPIYLIMYWYNFLKCFFFWIFIKFFKKEEYYIELNFYMPKSFFFKQFVLVIFQTPRYFAVYRFYKIITFKNKFNFSNLFINILIFFTKLPVNMYYVVSFWFEMLLIIFYDFDNFGLHYVRLQSKFFK